MRGSLLRQHPHCFLATQKLAFQLQRSASSTKAPRAKHGGVLAVMRLLSSMPSSRSFIPLVQMQLRGKVLTRLHNHGLTVDGYYLSQTWKQ
jgi:hypothetical protein